LGYGRTRCGDLGTYDASLDQLERLEGEVTLEVVD
jgi:hypothetical protein